MDAFVPILATTLFAHREFGVSNRRFIPSYDIFKTEYGQCDYNTNCMVYLIFDTNYKNQKQSWITCGFHKPDAPRMPPDIVDASTIQFNTQPGCPLTTIKVDEPTGPTNLIPTNKWNLFPDNYGYIYSSHEAFIAQYESLWDHKTAFNTWHIGDLAVYAGKPTTCPRYSRRFFRDKCCDTFTSTCDAPPEETITVSGTQYTVREQTPEEYMYDIDNVQEDWYYSTKQVAHISTLEDNYYTGEPVCIQAIYIITGPKAYLKGRKPLTKRMQCTLCNVGSYLDFTAPALTDQDLTIPTTANVHKQEMRTIAGPHFCRLIPERHFINIIWGRFKIMRLNDIEGESKNEAFSIWHKKGDTAITVSIDIISEPIPCPTYTEKNEGKTPIQKYLFSGCKLQNPKRDDVAMPARTSQNISNPRFPIMKHIDACDPTEDSVVLTTTKTQTPLCANKTNPCPQVTTEAIRNTITWIPNACEGTLTEPIPTESHSANNTPTIVSSVIISIIALIGLYYAYQKHKKNKQSTYLKPIRRFVDE